MPASYIYLLHFDAPLGHAEHYSGCTTDLRRRLEDHAQGHGSALTRALHAQGRAWTLAALSVVPHAQMRRTERSLKDQHNGPRYCPICCAPEQPLVVPETVPYCLDHLRMPIRSTEYPRVDRSTPQVVIRDLTALADPVAMAAIADIYHSEQDTLGWIPIGGQAGLNRLKHDGGLTIISAGTEIVGYAAWSASHSLERLCIHQCAVRVDRRLRQYGRLLVASLSARHPTATVIAKVRDDLAANHFWSQIGFARKRTAKHRTSGSTIHHYYHPPLFGARDDEAPRQTDRPGKPTESAGARAGEETS